MGLPTTCNPLKRTFSKYERLSSKKIIEQLFQKGSENVKTAFCYPFRISYLHDSAHTERLPEVLFSISRRSFRHATDRNLVRRRCKEAYRLNKALFVDNDPTILPSYIGFVYVSKEIMPFEEIEKRLKKALKMLISVP